MATIINNEAFDKQALLTDFLSRKLTINNTTQTLATWFESIAGGHGTHKVGDICYWDGSQLCFCTSSQWDSALGTPLAVCVIPSDHAFIWGDGKARFLSIHGLVSGGTSASTEQYMAWSTSSTDTGLPNYTKLPTWNNVKGGTTSSNTSGFMSSDKFSTNTANTVDKKSYYNQTSNLIPSPYLEDETFNTDYIRTISGYNNGMTDFNGRSNTKTLVDLSSSVYVAANACYKYSTDGLSAGTWYLPGLGEASYMLPRYNVINSSITLCGGTTLASADYYWTSTENTSSYSYFVRTTNGSHNVSTKTLAFYARPYVALD